jgi:hypothetical protein
VPAPLLDCVAASAASVVEFAGSAGFDASVAFADFVDFGAFADWLASAGSAAFADFAAYVGSAGSVVAVHFAAANFGVGSALGLVAAGVEDLVAVPAEVYVERLERPVYGGSWRMEAAAAPVGVVTLAEVLDWDRTGYGYFLETERVASSQLVGAFVAVVGAVAAVVVAVVGGAAVVHDELLELELELLLAAEPACVPLVDC